jgi:hypothetical protein
MGVEGMDGFEGRVGDDFDGAFPGCGEEVEVGRGWGWDVV